MSQDLKLLHFTRGGIWFGKLDFGSNLWMTELAQLLVGENPKATARAEWPPVGTPQVNLVFDLDESEVN